MSVDESSVLAKCLDFSRSLLDKGTRFTFQVKTESGFSFNLYNQDTGKPELKKRNKTPSQLRRNQERLEEFIVKKKSEAVANSAEYELKMDVHASCTDQDTMEVIQTNFIEDLKVRAKDKQFEELKLFKIKKVQDKQVIRKIEGVFRNLEIFRIVIKDHEIARNIIEEWKQTQNFDSRAFRNSHNSEMVIEVKEIRKLG